MAGVGRTGNGGNGIAGSTGSPGGNGGFGGGIYNAGVAIVGLEHAMGVADNYVNTKQLNESAVNSTVNAQVYNVGGSVNVSSAAVGKRCKNARLIVL